LEHTVGYPQSYLRINILIVFIKHMLGYAIFLALCFKTRQFQNSHKIIKLSTVL